MPSKWRHLVAITSMKGSRLAGLPMRPFWYTTAGLLIVSFSSILSYRFSFIDANANDARKSCLQSKYAEDDLRNHIYQPKITNGESQHENYQKVLQLPYL